MLPSTPHAHGSSLAERYQIDMKIHVLARSNAAISGNAGEKGIVCRRSLSQYCGSRCEGVSHKMKMKIEAGSTDERKLTIAGNGDL